MSRNGPSGCGVARASQAPDRTGIACFEQKRRTKKVLPTPASPPRNTNRPTCLDVTAARCRSSASSCCSRSSRTLVPTAIPDDAPTGSMVLWCATRRKPGLNVDRSGRGAMQHKCHLAACVDHDVCYLRRRRLSLADWHRREAAVADASTQDDGPLARPWSAPKAVPFPPSRRAALGVAQHDGHPPCTPRSREGHLQ